MNGFLIIGAFCIGAVIGWLAKRGAMYWDNRILREENEMLKEDILNMKDGE